MILRSNRITKKGFTLAEVLITLTIIGVIAAITVPSLMQQVQDEKYKTAWKKTYAEFEEAYKILKLNNGNSLLGYCTNNNAQTDARCYMNKFGTILYYQKNCGLDLGGPNKCWHVANGTEVKNVNGTISLNIERTYANAVLNNGTLTYWTFGNSNCANSSGGQAAACFRVYFDINGYSPPNRLGKDIFKIYVFEDKIVPYSWTYFNPTDKTDSIRCKPSATQDYETKGLECSTQYLLE